MRYTERDVRRTEHISPTTTKGATILLATPTQICLTVRDHIPEILEDWQTLLDDRPWLELPEDVGLDHLPEVVDSLVDVAVRDSADGDDPRYAVVAYAIKHGRHRRQQGYDDHSLFQEFHLLREAIWMGIRRRYPQDPSTFEAIGRLDSAITAATRASLHGFHMGKGAGEDLVDRLVEECSWPLPPEEAGREPDDRDGSG